jgi:hypothetical protein
MTITCVAITALAFGMPAGAADAGHCAFALSPVSRSGSTTTARAVLIGCYTTYEAAVEAGYGGTVDVAEGSTPVSLTSEQLTTMAAGDVLIGTEWTATGYAGTSNSYFASTTCSSAQVWQLNYVGDSWNDSFGSGKGFGGCDINKKFEDADYGGAVLTCTPNCSGYGSLNNRVSSLKWKP